jgi:predicted transcriptional regulator
MTTLRASQIETLKLVDKLETATPDEVSRWQERYRSGAERSLRQLEALGYLAREWESNPANGHQHCFYRLTNKGRSALSGRES